MVSAFTDPPFFLTVEVDDLSRVWNKHNFFQLRHPETLAISLISSGGPIYGKALFPYNTNYMSAIKHKKYTHGK